MKLLPMFTIQYGLIPFHSSNTTIFLNHFVQLAVEKITIDKTDGTPTIFYQNKEIQSLYIPFLIAYNGDTISRLLFKRHDAVWAKNFKRAIASALQVQGSKEGAFVVKEVSVMNGSMTCDAVN